MRLKNIKEENARVADFDHYLVDWIYPLAHRQHISFSFYYKLNNYKN